MPWLYVSFELFCQTNRVSKPCVQSRAWLQGVKSQIIDATAIRITPIEHCHGDADTTRQSRLEHDRGRDGIVIHHNQDEADSTQGVRQLFSQGLSSWQVSDAHGLQANRLKGLL